MAAANRRIHNDYQIKWHILNRSTGEPYPLEGKDLRITLSIGASCSKRITDYTVEGNTITFDYLGKDQTVCGLVVLKLEENAGKEGMRTVDTKEVMNLVAHSWDTSDDDSTTNLEVETVELTSSIDAGVKGKDGFSPAAAVEETEEGATITITDKSGTTTAKVKNGKDGKDGDTPTWDDFSEEDKAKIIEAILSNVPLADYLKKAGGEMSGNILFKTGGLLFDANNLSHMFRTTLGHTLLSVRYRNGFMFRIGGGTQTELFAAGDIEHIKPNGEGTTIMLDTGNITTADLMTTESFNAIFN